LLAIRAKHRQQAGAYNMQQLATVASG